MGFAFFISRHVLTYQLGMRCSRLLLQNKQELKQEIAIRCLFNVIEIQSILVSVANKKEKKELKPDL